VAVTDVTTRKGRIKENWAAAVKPLGGLLDASIACIRAAAE
jgi:hypothetical protein